MISSEFPFGPFPGRGVDDGGKMRADSCCALAGKDKRRYPGRRCGAGR